MLVSLLTCTSDRPAGFRLCERWMSRQTYAGDIEWIVVDDGITPATCTQGQVHMRLNPVSDPRASFKQNMLAGIRAISGDVALFVEDDDWYAPGYVAAMVDALQRFPLVGSPRARQYHVNQRMYRLCENDGHASLAQTGIGAWELTGMLGFVLHTTNPFYDKRIWKALGPAGLVVDRSLSVGIKGLPGKGGLSVVHRHPVNMRMVPDPDGTQLREWLGADAEEYLAMGGQS